MADIIQFRRDTAANFTSVNPILHAGEPGFETDTCLFKIGDGVSAWADLCYSQNIMLDIDGALADNSDTNFSSQKAVKTYADTKLAKIGGSTTDKTLTRTSGTSGAALLSSGVVLSDNNELYLARINELADSTTTRTLSASVDMGCTVNFSNTANITVTLPANLPVGFSCSLIQGSTGQVQLAAASGATINNRLGYTATAGQYAQIFVEVTANSDGLHAVYNLCGDAAQTTGASGSPIIQSIQQVSITIAAGATSNTATISSVTTANSYCHWQGQTMQVSTFSADTCLASITLTNSTTVTAIRNTSDVSNSITVNATVVQFVASVVIQSIQQGTIAIGSGATSNTATISSVTTTNSFVHFQGQTFNSTTGATNYSICTGALTLTNATTVTAARTTASTSTLTIGYVVVEFKAGVLTSSTQAISSSAASVALTVVDSRFAMVVPAGFIATDTASDARLVPRVMLGAPETLLQIFGSGTCVVKSTIVEFSASQVKSIQRVRPVILATTTSIATTLRQVVTGKTLVNYLGHYASTNLQAANTGNERVTLTDSVTATSTRNTSHATITLTGSLEIVEFQ